MYASVRNDANRKLKSIFTMALQLVTVSMATHQQFFSPLAHTVPLLYYTAVALNNDPIYTSFAKIIQQRDFLVIDSMIFILTKLPVHPFTPCRLKPVPTVINSKWSKTITFVFPPAAYINQDGVPTHEFRRTSFGNKCNPLRITDNVCIPSLRSCSTAAAALRSHVVPTYSL